MACQIETVAYPAWWSEATTIGVYSLGGLVFTGTPEEIELLPEGVACPQGVSNLPFLLPWTQISRLQKAS